MNNIYDMLNDAEQYEGRIERVELTDVEKRKILNQITGQKHKKHGTRTATVAAAFAAVLIVGTSAYAAVKHFGIVDYYANNSSVNLPQEEVEKLVDTQVQQELVGSDNEEDSLVDFHIREALCDNNQLVVEVEAVPTDPEHYILAPTDCDLNCPATDLLIDGVTEGTAGEYAAAQGKEILRVGAMIADESITGNSMDFVREEDGTLMIVVTCANVIQEDIMNLTCLTNYINAKDHSVENVVHGEFTFKLTDESNTRQLVYVPDDDTAAEDIGGSVLDELVVDQTELTIGIQTKWHLTKALSEQEKIEDYAIDFHIYTEDGTRLEFIMGSGQGETCQQLADGTWELERTDVYETMDLPDTLIVKAYDYSKAEEVGEFVVHLKK